MSCIYDDDDDCSNSKKGFVCPHCKIRICYRCKMMEKCHMVTCAAPEDHKDYLKEVPLCPTCPDSIGIGAHMEYVADYKKYMDCVKSGRPYITGKREGFDYDTY